jgi:hypothetical protein
MINDFQIGDTVELTKHVDNQVGRFAEGHKFTIEYKSLCGEYDLINNYGHRLRFVRHESFRKVDN